MATNMGQFSETVVWDRIRRGMGNRWYAVRHENRAAGRGTPDVSWAYSGRRGWIELKAAPKLARTVNMSKWTPQQKAFATADLRHGGGGSFLACGFPDRLLVWDCAAALELFGIEPARPTGEARRVARLDLEWGPTLWAGLAEVLAAREWPAGATGGASVALAA